MAARQVWYEIEYAKTGRSTCAKSKKPIAQGAVRVGRNSPSPFHDGYVTKWYLLDAFFKATKYATDVKTASQFKGFGDLRIADQQKVKKYLGQSTEVDVEIEEANKSLWSVRDKVDDQLSLKELKAALEANDEGGKDTLVARVADGLVFGRATCATCPNNNACQMSFREGLYHCSAQLQWGTCGYKGTDVVIHKWKTPDDIMQAHPFLRECDTAGPSSRPVMKIEKAAVSEYRRDVRAPLRGMKFASIGRLTSMRVAELKTSVVKNGGAWSDKIAPDVDYVVATYATVLARPAPFLQAEKLDLAIVSELLVDRLLHEFGFDQKHYLLAGKLPAIAHAKLAIDKPLSAANASAEGSSNASASSSLAALVSVGRIDPAAGAPQGKIHKDANTTYDIVLSATDIKTGDNKYYVLQMIDVDGNGNRFIVFRKWGRVGTTIGGNARTNPSGFNSALEFFKENYLDKTGNDWDKRAQFQKAAGKYFPIEVAKESSQAKGEAEDSGVNENLPSYLDPRVRSVVETIFDESMIKREMIALEIDVAKMPLGNLTQQRIKEGYGVLTEIEQILKANDATQSFHLLTLSNKFYTLIPTDFGSNQVQIIDSLDILRRKMKQLEALADIEVASSLMKKQRSIVGLHPVDANYNSLGADLKPLSRYSREFKTVQKYVDNGYDQKGLGYKIVLDDIFAVKSADNTDDFANYKNIRPRKLLWHGSRLCNYVGILNQGLRIAPPEAPVSGYMFGKGIYFADRVQKSIAFCHASKENPTGLLLLADVVLGEPLELKKPEFIERLPPGKSSALALAKTIPDPNKDEFVDDKVIVPLGPGVPSEHKDVFLEDQEFIVYQRQVRIKYLVKVHVEYPKGK